MLTVEQYEAEHAEWLAYVDANSLPCKRCKKFYEGASWSGRCYDCHFE